MLLRSSIVLHIILLARHHGGAVTFGPSSSTDHNVADSDTTTSIPRGGGHSNHQRNNKHLQKRTVMAWTTWDRAADTIQQIRNESWVGILDGMQALCGASIKPDGSGITLNTTYWREPDGECTRLLKAAHDVGCEFHLWVGGAVPLAAYANPQPIIKDSIRLVEQYNLDGISIDDEYDCAPRSTLHRFRDWMTFVNTWAVALWEATDTPLTAAVQAMFGIQNVPYQPDCGPGKRPDECSQACDKLPSAYPLEPEVTQLMSNSAVDRFLVMDTYYFTTARFLNAFDWYVDNIANDRLAMALMNRDDLSDDGLLARFYAIHKSNVDWINIFLLPADDMFLPYLRRWKTHCAGCGVQSVLGCFDLTVPCNHGVTELSTG